MASPEALIRIKPFIFDASVGGIKPTGGDKKNTIGHENNQNHIIVTLFILTAYKGFRKLQFQKILIRNYL